MDLVRDMFEFGARHGLARRIPEGVSLEVQRELANPAFGEVGQEIDQMDGEAVQYLDSVTSQAA